MQWSESGKRGVKMSDDLPRFDPERDTEWRERLTEMQYHITREAGTEPPNSGIHYMEDR